MLTRTKPLPPRKAAIKRGPVRSRRKPKSHAATRGSKAFLDWLHMQPPVCRHLPTPCAGAVQAAHLTPKGVKAVGRKGPWEFQVSMCGKHHAEIDQHRGCFEGWSPFERQVWMECAVSSTQAAWRAFLGEEP